MAGIVKIVKMEKPIRQNYIVETYMIPLFKVYNR